MQAARTNGRADLHRRPPACALSRAHSRTRDARLGHQPDVTAGNGCLRAGGAAAAKSPCRRRSGLGDDRRRNRRSGRQESSRPARARHLGRGKPRKLERGRSGCVLFRAASPRGGHTQRLPARRRTCAIIAVIRLTRRGPRARQYPLRHDRRSIPPGPAPNQGRRRCCNPVRKPVTATTCLAPAHRLVAMGVSAWPDHSASRLTGRNLGHRSAPDQGGARGAGPSAGRARSSSPIPTASPGNSRRSAATGRCRRAWMRGPRRDGGDEGQRRAAACASASEK